MGRNNLGALLAPLVAGIAFSSCASQSEPNSVAEVNDLVDRIERVHLNTELARARVKSAIKSELTIVDFQFHGDAVSAYAQFKSAAEESARQVEELRGSIAAMKEIAEPVFRKWVTDLDAITNLDLRLKSQNRLTQTRGRYDAVVAAADPAQLAYDQFNKTLHDHTVYLGHDFNAASVTSLQGDAHQLAEAATLLDTKFASCQEAARVYVEAAALPMSSSGSTDQPTKGASKSPAKPSSTSKKSPPKSDGS